MSTSFELANQQGTTKDELTDENGKKVTQCMNKNKFN